MKHLLLFFLIALLFVRCGSLMDPLPGLYVSSSVNEFSVVQDSLVVVRSNDNDKYVINRTMMIEYFRKEERLPQFKTDQWIALYDDKTKTLSVQQNGKSLYFDEEKNGLFLGKTLYKKIDDAKNVDDLVSRNH